MFMSTSKLTANPSMDLLALACTELLQQEELLTVDRDSKLYVPIRHTMHQSPEKLQATNKVLTLINHE